MRLLTGVSALLLAMSLASCARNSILEVELVPSRDLVGVLAPGTSHVLMQWRDSQVGFPSADGGDWAVEQGRDLQLPWVADEPLRVSVLGAPEVVDARLRVRFCTTPRCDAIADVDATELRFELERPFFAGRRSRWRHELTPRPLPSVEHVTQCAIEACVDGLSGTEAFCAPDGRHVCDL